MHRHRRLLLPPLLWMAGCAWTPERFEAARAPFLDLDGDGYSEAEGDCQPHDPASHPGAEERCDDIDNDCNGRIDDAPADSWIYPDADGDGFGNGALPQAACDAPAGFVRDASDCDDSRASAGPGMPEQCNDLDDNCDGNVDEGAPADRRWYPDSDGDGHGQPATPVASCPQPAAGYVRMGDDCDDLDPLVSPSADERCNGLDDNCNEEIDEQPAVDAPGWSVDADGDGYGDDATTIEQCAAPSDRYVARGGDCDDLDPAVHPGAPEICNEQDDDCDGFVDDPPTVGDGVWYRDDDEDGYGDIAGGTSTCDPAPGLTDVGGDCDDGDPAVNPAATEVCNDGIDNDCDETPDHCVWDSVLDLTDHTTVFGARPRSNLGGAGGHGDLNGDGTTEVYVSAYNYYNEDAAAYSGLICGWDTPMGPAPAVDGCDLAFDGSALIGIGNSFAIGDVDSDGYDDLVSGNATDSRSGILGEGSAYILLGPSTGAALDDTADWELTNDGELELFGQAARILGDLDGNGSNDFGVGGHMVSNTLSEQGVVYLYTSLGSGTSDAQTAASATIEGSEAYDWLGHDFGSMDVNGDSMEDVLVGAVYAGSDDEGAALLYTGPVLGDYTDRDADAALVGEHNNSGAGFSVDAGGDLNDDGYPDLLIGADQDTESGGSGAVFIVWGSSTLADLELSDADIVIRGDVADERFGHVVRGLGDVNQDGIPDVGVNSRASTGDKGSAYLLWGPLSTAGTFTSSSLTDVAMAGEADEDLYIDFILAVDANADTVPDIVVGSGSGGPDQEGVMYIVPGVGY